MQNNPLLNFSWHTRTKKFYEVPQKVASVKEIENYIFSHAVGIEWFGLCELSESNAIISVHVSDKNYSIYRLRGFSQLQSELNELTPVNVRIDIYFHTELIWAITGEIEKEKFQKEKIIIISFIFLLIWLLHFIF